MGYFEQLLRKRKLETCPLPLWKLKITEEEYEELRRQLREETRFFSYYEKPFRKLNKEACLFFAEYWRREFNSGTHSKRMVYDALDPIGKREEQVIAFYEAARRGAKVLGIERFEGGRTAPLEDMLYQGGLPMRLLTERGENSVWERFVRGLVHRHIDFEELQLGLVAKQSNGLRDYCNQLIAGIESEQHMLMPFYCNDENNRWFGYLKELARQERIRQRHSRAFSLNWEFTIDRVGKKIQTKYDIRGMQRLPLAFIEDQHLEDVNFFSAQVQVNGKAVDTFDYANNFCRYAIVSKHPFRDGDSIALFIANHSEPLLTGDLDMNVPHLLGQTQNGLYELAGQLGKQENVILIPDGWEVENDYGMSTETFLWGEMELRTMFVDSSFDGSIKLIGSDGTIEFGQGITLFWTELQNHPLYIPDIVESVYDASKCRFKLCYDTAEGEKSYPCENVEYRSKRQKEWANEPAYGEIFARAKDNSGHYFVTPIRFINVGDGLTISLQNADKESCRIKVAWTHGHVSSVEGVRKTDDVWEVKKENCEDPRRIHFILTPSIGSQNQFILSVKAPFMEFSIDDIYGKHISNDTWVPYSEVDKYQYHLVGQNIKSYTYGNVVRELRWFGDKLYIVENGQRKKSIPYEGSLLTLFDNREVLRSMLDRTSKNMIEAEIPVTFTLSGGEQITFAIKDSPFRVKQFEDGRVFVTAKGGRLVNFKGVLKLAKLDDPSLAPIEMSYDEDNGYVLPEQIRAWGKTLLFGRTRGRICPSLVDLNKFMDSESRRHTREETIANISASIKQAKMGSEEWQRIIGWFNRTQKEDIPASSLLELVCVAQSPQSLLHLAFMLYMGCGSEEEKMELQDQLLSMSTDLAFQWYWLMPHLKGVLNSLQQLIESLDNKSFMTAYIRWSMQQDMQNEYLQAIGSEKYYDYAMQCMMSLHVSFTEWMKGLFRLSLLETYGDKADKFTSVLSDIIIFRPKEMLKEEIDYSRYVEHSQDYIDEPTTEFFNKFRDSGFNDNEQWLYKRVNVVVAQLRNKLDLFGMDEKIRRSIIYCNKANLYRFIVELNNRLLITKK